MVDGDGRILLRGVKGVEVAHILARHVCIHARVNQEGHQRAVGRVAADDAAVGVGGRVVQTDADRHFVLERQGKLLHRRELAHVARRDFHDAQLALGNRAGLVGEKQRQRAGSFQTVDFVHQHVILRHAHALIAQQDAGEHRQPFRHSADDNRYRHGNGLDGQVHPFHKGIGDIAAQQRPGKHAHDDGNRADIAEGRNLLGELGQLDLQGRFTRILLHFQRQFAEQRLIADDLDLHVGFAAANHRAAINIAAVQQILGVVGFAAFVDGLGCFLGFAVERRLVNLHKPFDNLAVCGDFVARLQIHQIAHHDFADVDFHQLAVTQHLRNFLGFFLRLQCGCFAFLLIFADGRHAVGNHDRNQNADRLIPVRLAHEAQHHLDDQRHEQNHNHRVFEALKDFLPQRFRGNLREGIRAVLLAAFLHLLFVQPLKIHCSSSTSSVSAPDCAFCQPYICYFTSYFLVLQVSSGAKKHQIHPTVVLSVAKPQAAASIIHFSRPKARGAAVMGVKSPAFGKEQLWSQAQHRGRAHLARHSIDGG